MLGVTLNLPKLHSGPFAFAPRPIPLKPKVKKHLSLPAWMERHRAHLGPDKPFDWEHHAYLRALYAETAQRLVICKSGQAGVSEYLISYALHACDQRDATVMYIFPTDTHVSDFSAARMGPAIESSEYLASIVVEAHATGGKRGADRVTLKRVRNRFLYFRGAKVKVDGQAPQLKSVDADVLIFDEWDEMDARAPAIARKRTGHSRIDEERIASTPTYPGRGIHAEYQKSDQREWHVRCTACGHRQPITIQDIVIEWDELERPVVWHGQPDGRAYPACKKCKAELDRLMPGEWVAAHPDRGVAGYHITKLFSPFADPLSIVKRLRSTDETERKECFNQDLGLPYRPRGGGLDDAALDACQRDYGHTFTTDATCYMGIDVGKVLHVVVRTGPNPESGERRQLFAGEATWSELPLLWDRYRPAITVIDALPETSKAREFQASRPGDCWVAYYSNQSEGLKDVEPVRKDGDDRAVHLDRTRTLDGMVARFLERSNTLPANAREIPNYYDQMKAPVRVIEERQAGEDVARYVESGPDHFFHAENYCHVASLLIDPGIASMRQATVYQAPASAATRRTAVRRAPA